MNRHISDSLDPTIRGFLFGLATTAAIAAYFMASEFRKCPSIRDGSLEALLDLFLFAGYWIVMAIVVGFVGSRVRVGFRLLIMASVILVAATFAITYAVNPPPFEPKCPGLAI
jgi:hypothetical protein